jgi:hypothetical protein
MHSIAQRYVVEEMRMNCPSPHPDTARLVTAQGGTCAKALCLQRLRRNRPRLAFFRGGQTIFSTASGLASRHAPRLALALMVMLAHHHAGRAALRQTGAGTHPRLRSLSHHGLRRAAAVASLGDKVVAYVATLQGRQVGDGECFALADNALASAGARSAASYGEISPDADYVWGRPVSLSQLQPGDVLQFRNFRIVKRITTLQQTPDAQVVRSESEDIEERDHHTAVVERNFGDSVSIFEQNVEPEGRIVQRHRIALVSHTETETDLAGASRTVTQISVDGEVRAYRAEKAPSAEMAAITTQGNALGTP